LRRGTLSLWPTPKLESQSLSAVSRLLIQYIRC
jgi:hypothetical protein